MQQNCDEDKHKETQDAATKLMNETLSVANATINTTLEIQESKSKIIFEDSSCSPKIKKSTGVGLERMESLTALAFDPKKSKPGPKRSSLLVKQGFTNISGENRRSLL